MSYLNRYDHGPKRNGYDPNKNYDANIFNTDTRQPEYVRYNDVSPFVDGHRSSHYVSKNILSHIPFQDNYYLKNNLLSKSHSQTFLDNKIHDINEYPNKCPDSGRRNSVGACINQISQKCDNTHKPECNNNDGAGDLQKPIKHSQSEMLEIKVKVPEEIKLNSQTQANVVIIENPRVVKHINSNTAEIIEDKVMQPEKGRYLYHSRDNYNRIDSTKSAHHIQTQPDLKSDFNQEEKKVPDSLGQEKTGYAYICNCCLNQGVCMQHCNKKRVEQEEKEKERNTLQTTIRNQHIAIENFNALNRKKLVEEREKYSKEAASYVKPVLEKEILAKKLEEKEYSLNDNTKKFFVIEKTKEKEKKIDNFCSSTLQNFHTADTKPRTTDYFQNLKENPLPNEFHYALTDKNNQRKYNDCLKEQVIKKKIEEEKKKLEELNYALELRGKQINRNENEDKKRNSRCKKAKDEYISQSNIFCESKRNLEQTKKEAEKQSDKNYISNLVSVTERLQKERDELKIQNRLKLTEVLNKQVQEKKNRQCLVRSQEKIVDPQRIYKFVENYDSCVKCHKVYPVRALNMTNFTSLNSARIQKNIEKIK